MLTEDEKQQLILNFLYHNGGSAHQDDVQKIIEWAEKVRLENATLDCVLSFDLSISLQDGEPHFGMTPKGNKHVETNLLPLLH